MTFGDWLDHCRTELEKSGLWFGHGTDNAHDEAAWLVLAALGRPPDGRMPGGNLEVDPEQGKRIERLLQQRVQTRQPLAYLVGEAWFCDLRFLVTPDVLVPRSPIAELVRGEFRPWIRPKRVSRVLDLCTGCGAIGIAVALHMPGVEVDASDISFAALKIAAKNRAIHGAEDRVTLIESDLFGALDGRRYDLVISNPPYVSKAQFDVLPREYRAEPEIGLVSSGHGLFIPFKILRDAPEHLSPEGILVCEVGENAASLQALLPDVPLTWIEFEHGGEGVFTIGRDEMLAHRQAIEQALEGLQDVV